MCVCVCVCVCVMCVMCVRARARVCARVCVRAMPSVYVLLANSYVSTFVHYVLAFAKLRITFSIYRYVCYICYYVFIFPPLLSLEKVALQISMIIIINPFSATGASH